MINFIYQKYARIDILVNNARFSDYGLLELVIIKDFNIRRNINVKVINTTSYNIYYVN